MTLKPPLFPAPRRYQCTFRQPPLPGMTSPASGGVASQAQNAPRPSSDQSSFEVGRLVQESKQPPILIVDEAQHLRNDVLEDLRLLTSYAMDADNRLCLLLVGLTELRRHPSRWCRCMPHESHNYSAKPPE